MKNPKFEIRNPKDLLRNELLRPFGAWCVGRGKPRATLVPRFALGWLVSGRWPWDTVLFDAHEACAIQFFDLFSANSREPRFNPFGFRISDFGFSPL
jgi:hypothetical protein